MCCAEDDYHRVRPSVIEILSLFSLANGRRSTVFCVYYEGEEEGREEPTDIR
jgi:hypothetical protein